MRNSRFTERQINQDIHTASREQSDGASRVQQAVCQMNKGTSTAAEPSGQAQLLRASVDTVKVQSLNRRAGRGDQGAPSRQLRSDRHPSTHPRTTSPIANDS